jgi:hypothetical protein
MPQPCAEPYLDRRGAALPRNWRPSRACIVYDLPHTTSSASSVDLDDMGEYPLFTRTHPSDANIQHGTFIDGVSKL